MDSVLWLEVKSDVGAAAMSLSSFCVVTNALRLNLFSVHNAEKIKNKIKKESRGQENGKNINNRRNDVRTL